MLVITPTFTANFNTSFGSNAVAAQAAWRAAASVFTTNFTDNIHIYITVDAISGTSSFGQSSTSLLPISYADLRAKVVADATTSNDHIAISPGGSMTAADPTNGTGNWWLTRAQAKALAVIPDDQANDGTITFGAGNSFTFSGAIAAETYDFQGVAAHELSEVMGRLGLSGGKVGSTANSFSLIDNFSYTAAGKKGLVGGPGEYFSIDNGTTLLKLFNDPTTNGLDSRDWAPDTNDSFNQFSDPGVTNPVSAVDLQLMDVLGYDLVSSAAAVAAPSAVFRGAGCLACNAQLQEFAKFAKQFQTAGVTVIAVSSTTSDDLKSAGMALAQKQMLPFVLLADPDYETFKSYGCLGEQDNVPLHGVFMIDAKGKITWREVTDKPYMNVKRVLELSSR